ncbi:MAG: hypothetical protein OEL87_01310 [Nanoarchaeota archaeon]|nr:hypothetical protein [Nanoarchaeota archaeon]
MEAEEILKAGKQVLNNYIDAVIAEKVDDMDLSIGDYNSFESQYRAKVGLGFPEGMRRVHEGLFLLDSSMLIEKWRKIYSLNEAFGGKDSDFYSVDEVN